MAAIISLLIIAAVSLLIVRIGATALSMTGLSRDIADFQAYSAFFGVGFTTRESEMVMSHPVRRRIVRDLIIFGNLGVTAAVSSLVVAFVRAEDTRDQLIVLGLILGGAGVLWVLISLPPVRRAIDWTIRAWLRRAGVLHAMDFELLLRIHAGYCVTEYEVPADSPLVGRSLRDSALGSRGVVVLGITRDAPEGGGEVFVGTPSASEIIRADDVLTVYAHEPQMHTVLSAPLPETKQPRD